jgi:copper chaperone CopZ
MLLSRILHAARRPLLTLSYAIFGACCLATTAAADDPAATTISAKYAVTGLFQPDRERDLRAVFATLPNTKLVSLDYENAEIKVEYEPAKLWPGQKPEKYLELFDNQLRTASKQTFSVKQPRTVPLDKLTQVEIPIFGLDCKGCSYAAYGMISKLPGVDRATASFKSGKIVAWIDPEKTKREDLEAALKKGGANLAPATE